MEGGRVAWKNPQETNYRGEAKNGRELGGRDIRCRYKLGADSDQQDRNQ